MWFTFLAVVGAVNLSGDWSVLAALNPVYGVKFLFSPHNAAGIAVMGALRERPELVARIEAEYARSLAWCKDNAEACGKAVAARIDLLSPEAVTDSIAVSQLEAVSVADARAELEFMFGKLVAKNPALVGGKLPDEGFYAGATTQ